LVAVDGVSFTLEAGLILGLLGPNGAGKTSLMKAIAGLNEMTHGQIEINGYSLETQRAQAIGCLGFQPDHPPYYEDLKVYEFLELFASAYGVLPDLRKKRIETLVELVI
jgi:ABC-2 type transport system ATP-binding protein